MSERSQPGMSARATTSTTARDEARSWLSEAIRRVDADANRSADTHLHVFPMPVSFGVDLYLKDESVHPTGSLKHRLARSLFLYALCNGWITEGTHGRRGVERFDCGERGVLRPAARSAVRRRDAGVDEQGEGRADRVLRRTVPLRRACRRRVRGSEPARRRARRALHRPVHDGRAGHRLARQQQHRRVDLPADVRRAIPDPDVGRGRRRHGRHVGHDRPLPAVPASPDAAGGGRSRELGVPARLRATRPDR